MEKEAFNKVANELHRHWADTIEQATTSDVETETYVVCSCGEWVLVATTPSVGDPVFEFTKHCTEALFKIPLLAITALRNDTPKEPTSEA